MKYWPMSVVRSSPLMPAYFQPELDAAPRTLFMSHLAATACGHVADNTPCREMPNLVIIETLGKPARQAFIDYPTDAEWQSIERFAVIQNTVQQFLIIDALH